MKRKGIFQAVLLAALTVTGFAQATPVPGGTLKLNKVPKYVTPLAKPGVMPNTGANSYEIVAGQTLQQILPSGFGMTTVWGYGPLNGTITFPGRTIEAQANTPVTVKWVNGLMDGNNNFLPHFLAVDQTLHWANPPGLCLEESPTGTDCRGMDQTRYLGPVPIVTHLHGAHVGDKSDGYPEAWWLPAASNIDPTYYKMQGSHYDSEVATDAGAAVFVYPNDQRATTLWYHDHTLGMTRVNVYAGLAGFYLLRGGVGDAVTGTLPSGAYEVPLMIQDKSFNSDGSLFYPDSRTFFDGYTGPYIGDPSGIPSDVSPIWNPEFFGNTMVVNGNTWPFLNVEPRQYRFRILNACDSRALILTSAMPKKAQPLTFWQIGADGGFLPAPESRAQLLLGPAERADLIVDFSAYKPGDTITLTNIGPDEPFGGGVPGVDFAMADSGTTGQVMQFKVVPLTEADATTPAANLVLPAPVQLAEPTSSIPRRVSLNEEESDSVCVDKQMRPVPCGSKKSTFAGPTEGMLGTVEYFAADASHPTAGLYPITKEWMNQITENPALGDTEVWEIYNFTADAHPIHIHQVQFEILDRQALQTDADGMTMPPATPVGEPRGPDAGELGRKDTLLVYPGEMARVKAHFDISGLFVWHCHILSHEDNEMMRPMYVGPVPTGM